MRTAKHILKWFFRLLLASLIFITLINLYIYCYSAPLIYSPDRSPQAFVGIVPGARVYSNGRLSTALKDRAQTALMLYRQTRIRRILVSGDNASLNYNEVIPVRRWLIKQGVPREDIYLDYAGFDTYDTMYRARHLFKVRDVLVITQAFHLPRAVWLCSQVGMICRGVVADQHDYQWVTYSEMREIPARIKAFMDIMLNAHPRFMGDIIDIYGHPQTI